ncbi:MAG: DUF6503 family protein [Aurantibacter sp.]
MLRFVSTLILSLIFNSTAAQEIAGNELLEKAISYHDPNDNWKGFKGKLFITMETPNASNRVSEISMNLPAQYFKLLWQKDGDSVIQMVDRDSCSVSLNGSSKISEEKIRELRLTCDRTRTMRDYYTYLYGLPMKLRDPGTIIDPQVQKRAFKDKEYLVLKVSYEEPVGGDIWYFYFDPKTYALEVYQFFHDESKNDGEYILLSEEETVNGIKMPKIRAWYYNKDDKYLGTDVLTKASSH